MPKDLTYDTNLVVASNRGPARFFFDECGNLSQGRAGGGLASNLADLLTNKNATWICAALSDDERNISKSYGKALEFNSIDVFFVDLDRDKYSLSYDYLSNSILWFLYHSMFDRASRPTFDRDFLKAWEAYKYTNECFASKIIDHSPHGATVLVQDYHLHLVAKYVKLVRPDLTIVHFIHTPFCEPSELEMLPPSQAREILMGISEFDSCGFHSWRWKDNFLACCKELSVDPPRTFTACLGIDPQALERTNNSSQCETEANQIKSLIGSNKLILRVDRIEPSKNIIRGFQAFDLMLDLYPQFLGKVTFLALLNPSRETLEEYKNYRDCLIATVNEVNNKWLTYTSHTLEPGVDASWIPIRLEIADNFSRSVAAMRFYDVLLVNPVKDGLNLVAKEGPVINERNGSVVLSRQAGVFDELQGCVQPINPFDILETARCLGDSLELPLQTKTHLHTLLLKGALASTPTSWLQAQFGSISLNNTS